MRATLRYLPLSLCCIACAGPQSAASSAPASRPPTAAVTEASAPTPSAATAPPTSSQQPSTPPAPAFEVRHLLDFERVLPEPITSIAIGKDGRVAALSAEPWLLDAGRWRAIALPASQRPGEGEVDHVALFFGRDNRPRLMGARASASGETRAVYLRWKNAGWQREPSEIGRLGGLPHAAMFGVLGHDDPEVACKVGDVCIVKRITGWTTVPAGPGMPLVVMNDGIAWALHEDHVARMESNGWIRLQPEAPWKAPSGLWGSANGPLWVSVPADNALYRFDGKAWSKHDSPVDQPLGLWGSGDSDVWVVGASGAGHYDGSDWVRVDGLQGPLATATGGGPHDVWLGGPSGLWHGTKTVAK